MYVWLDLKGRRGSTILLKNHIPLPLSFHSLLRGPIVTKLRSTPGFSSALSFPWQLLQWRAQDWALRQGGREEETHKLCLCCPSGCLMSRPESSVPLLSPPPYPLLFVQSAPSLKSSCCQHLPQHFVFLPTSSHIAGRVLCIKHPYLANTFHLLPMLPLFTRSAQAVHSIACFSLSFHVSWVHSEHS